MVSDVVSVRVNPPRYTPPRPRPLQRWLRRIRVACCKCTDRRCTALFPSAQPHTTHPCPVGTAETADRQRLASLVRCAIENSAERVQSI